MRLIRKIIHILYFIPIVYQPLNALSQEMYFKRIDSLLKTKKDLSGIKLNSLNNQISQLNQETRLTQLPSTYNITQANGTIYVNLNGTGSVFKIDTTGFLKRVDSTFYQGASFGALFTSYKDTILQIGGYGYWNTTGAIRFFKEKLHEWDIFRTNENIAFAQGINGLIFEDKKDGKIYLIYQENTPEFIETNKPRPLQLQCLNLATKQWLKAPYQINPKIASDLNDISTVATSIDGIIINTRKHKNSLLLKFAENKVINLDERLTTDLIQRKNKLPEHISFAEKDGIVLYDYINDTLYTFDVAANYKEVLADKIYLQSNNFRLQEIYPLVIIILLITTILLSLKLAQRKRKTIKNPINEAEVDDSNHSNPLHFDSFFNKLDPDEKVILETILNNQKNNDKNTSIQELNTKMGIEKKPIKIQNNIRAASIGNINKKFSLFTSANDVLIERIRSDFDKRFFEYRLNKKIIHLLQKGLNNDLQ